MSNSLTISGQVTFQAPANTQLVNESFNLVTALTPNGSTLVKTIGSLTTSPASQTLPGVSTPGLIILRNLDGTNSITYGPNSAAQSGLIAPGSLNIWSPNGTALWAGTTTGTAALQIFAIST